MGALGIDFIMPAVLEGVRVVSLEQAVAAPLCSRRLALAGAEVVKLSARRGFRALLVL